MNVIDVTDLEKHYGARTIFSQVTFAVDETEKVGLIGRNGCGKSTLLRILGALDDSDGGTISRKKGASVVYLPQQPTFDDDLTAHEVLCRSLSAVYERRQRYDQILSQLEQASVHEMDSLLAQQQVLQEWFDHHQCWNVDHRIGDVCNRLGVTRLDQPVAQMSGGQQKRVALAGVLLQQPDLLMLDEPTNHLDAVSIQWLEEELLRYPGAVMLVTHDRYFLDRVATRMFELDDGQFQMFTGNYSLYLQQKQEQYDMEQTQQSRLLNLLRREEAWLHRGAKARTTKQKARIGRVDKLREQKQGPRRGDVSLQFSAEQKLGGTILELEHVQLQAGDLTLAKDVSLILRPGERLGILGPNGCGKSTLLKTILGEIPLVAGEVILGRKTQIGYIDQNRTGLDPEKTVAECLGEGDWVTVAGHKRHKTGYLEEFLFDYAEQRKPVTTLSGGERARLLLASLMLQGANLLVLDEPTNDLDIQTLQVLEQALIDFTGCVVIVTHDRYLLDRIATATLVFDGQGGVVRYEGNYSDMLLQQQPPEPVAPKKENLSETVTPSAKIKKQRKGLSYKEKIELEEIETTIADLEQEQGELEQALSDTVNRSVEELEELGRRFGEVSELLTGHYERWEVLELKKEGS
ncbi:ABC-F family ATP-binding cassette domain-containing protein [uncultured Desulfuromonas sp.]|uniref:ABC-F family ATP-binding cassette domain-containing protein n=1 Tax=uncultured Desulfuromonas sp. TaxID=181013 RepID=UPI002AABEC29|nr:ABC-F family ATP-binding cassette domain-containing protein [uncultured Desulfuromonas sp.]